MCRIAKHRQLVTSEVSPHGNGRKGKIDFMRDVPEIMQPVQTGEQNGERVEAEQQQRTARPKQADLLYELAAEHCEVFNNQDGEPYAFVQTGQTRQCHRIHSTAFQGAIVKCFRQQYRRIPGNQAISEACNALAHDATEHYRRTFTRIGVHEGKIYIDLGANDWDAIEIDAHGWRWVAQPPVAFHRSKHMKPLPMPQAYTDCGLLFRYVNVADEDEILVSSSMVMALHPHGPYPILAFTNEPGAGKSTNTRLLKMLFDDHVANLQSQPDDVRNLIVSAHNSWVLAFDNVSKIRDDVSDALCRIATGGGYRHRALNTNSDEMVFDVQRPIFLNGIGDVLTRSDLIERAVIIQPPTIPDSKRLDEATFWQRFNMDRPKIMGAFLNALSVSLRNLPQTDLPFKPRMADFARMAVAAEPATRRANTRSFIEVYGDNRSGAIETTLDDSLIAPRLRQLVLVRGEWTGRMSELLAELTKTPAGEVDETLKNNPRWPRSASMLSGELQRIASFLRKTGVNVEMRRATRGVMVTLKRIHEVV